MKFSILGLFFFLAQIVFGQGEKGFISKGDKFFENKKYLKALENYELAYKENEKNPHTLTRIGLCHFERNEYRSALQYLRDGIQLTPKPDKEILFKMARTYHFNHSFDKAIEYYNRSDPGKQNAKHISKLVNECQYGKELIVKPVESTVTNMGPTVNSPFHDYLPQITADRMVMYFTSRRRGSTGNKVDSEGDSFEDVYVTYNKGGTWASPANVGSPINTDGHDACIGISDDGQTMFTYQGINGGDIFISELKGEKWSKPEPISVNTEHFESSACLSPDGRTLYFVRKIEGTSRDIMFAKKTSGGKWSKPQPLPINTGFDEDAPFMHPDGKTLFFSSKGHTSMGGYDIFKTVYGPQGWSTPENLGYPINTALDDIYFVLSADGKYGYYASEKESGYGMQDLYSVRMPPSYHKPQLTMLKGKVKDAVTNEPLEATITITDNLTNEVVAQFRSNETSGEYLLPLPCGKNYGIAIEKAGHLFHSENVSLSPCDFKEVVKEIKLVNATPGSKVTLNNIFFDSGKPDLRPESTAELMRLVNALKNNPKIKIEISGHTDNLGDAKANQLLSEKRAQSVVTFLVSKGADAKRLKSKGYGSSQPVATNDTEAGRQENRRTEFKVLD